jgi:hypothetical protein
MEILVMGAQHKKAAFIAGTFTGPIFHSFRDPGTGKHHDLAFRARKTAAGVVEVMTMRWSTVYVKQGKKKDPEWIPGPVVPLASLLSVHPSRYLTCDQLRVRKVLMECFWPEIVAHAELHAPQQRFQYPLLMPPHRRPSFSVEGCFSVPTPRGTLVVFRSIDHEHEKVRGVSFTLLDLPLYHPLARRFMKRKREVVVMLDATGFPIRTEPGSLEAALMEMLLSRLVPTGISRSTFLGEEVT